MRDLRVSTICSKSDSYPLVPQGYTISVLQWPVARPIQHYDLKVWQNLSHTRQNELVSHAQFFPSLQDAVVYQKLFQKGCIIIYCRWWGSATESKGPICPSSIADCHLLQLHCFPPLTPPAPYVCQVVKTKSHDLDLMQHTFWLWSPLSERPCPTMNGLEQYS